MKKLALVLLTATLLALPSSPAHATEEREGESSAQACTDPYSTWGYSVDDMLYEVEIDLSGCDWWDGSPIQLEVTLSRLDAEGETTSNSWTLCGGFDRAFGVPPEEARERNATCEGRVELEHPGVEIARYRGEITYPWRDGPRTTGFTVFCSSPANRCQDA